MKPNRLPRSAHYSWERARGEGAQGMQQLQRPPCRCGHFQLVFKYYAALWNANTVHCNASLPSTSCSHTGLLAAHPCAATASRHKFTGPLSSIPKGCMNIRDLGRQVYLNRCYSSVEGREAVEGNARGRHLLLALLRKSSSKEMNGIESAVYKLQMFNQLSLKARCELVLACTQVPLSSKHWAALAAVLPVRGGSTQKQGA